MPYARTVLDRLANFWQKRPSMLRAATNDHSRLVFRYFYAMFRNTKNLPLLTYV